MRRVRRLAWYGLKRIVMIVPLLIGLVFITFMLIRLGSGNPAAAVAGPLADAQVIAQIEEELHLNEPLLVQFGLYLGDAATGNLGDSWIGKRPVTTEIRERLPITLELVTVATIVSIILGIGFGFISAMSKDKLPDHVSRVFGLIGISMPIFWLGLLLIFVFFAKLRWAPAPLGRLDIFVTAPEKVTGAPLLDSLIEGNWEAFRSIFAHMILPVVTIVLVVGATIAKQTRASVVEVRDSAPVRYARAMGLPRRRVWGIILHNALPSIVTFTAIAYSLLLGSSALVELVFSWGGLGQLGLIAVTEGDFWMVQGFVLSMGVITAFVYLLSDIVNAAIDPRVTL